MKQRIVFMGTPEYAAINLRALLDAGHQVVGVFTQPDKPKGRGGKISMPEAKVLAQKYGIPVFQPDRIRRDGVEDLKNLAPDLCITAAFGQILSEELLAIPSLGTVNVHASLLPKYRGSAPVNWAIIMGETLTGVTTMLTDKGIDTGDILLQQEVPILPGETAGELTRRLAIEGAALLTKTLDCMAHGNCPRTPQDEKNMSYYPYLTKETGTIDWQQSARTIVDLVRGLNPWPYAHTFSPLGTIKIMRARVEVYEGNEAPGTVLQSDPRQGMLIKAADDAVRVEKLQAPSCKVMAAKDYLCGHEIGTGMRFE